MAQCPLVLGRRSAHIAPSPRPGDGLCKLRSCMGRLRDGGCERFLQNAFDVHAQLARFEDPCRRRVGFFLSLV
jgi:hypothetical protein